MEAPIYVLYSIQDFYQNHRRYIQSKSNYQLAGNVLHTHKEAELCQPFITNADIGVTESYEGAPLDPDAVASPCGAIAATFFNDTFVSIKPSDGSTIYPIDPQRISWPGDRGTKYRRAPNSSQVQWIDPEDEHFIVWMRTAGLPNFKKLYGKIFTPMKAGKYSFTYQNNYKYGEDRQIILSSSSAIGGRNWLIPASCLTIGIGSGILGVLVLLRERRRGRVLEFKE